MKEKEYMEQQIDKLLHYHASNQLIFENLIDDSKKTNGVIPFVGEFFSKSTFGTRNDFVKEIQEKTHIYVKPGENVSDMGFLDLLDSLISIHKKGVIDAKLLSFYSDFKIDDKYIKNQAVSWIPYVNNGNCITANLDHVIDHSYSIAGKIPDITHPHEKKKLITLLRGGMASSEANIVLKLHGDVLSDAEHRILTQEDYELSYDKESEFYKTISQWLQNYIILFIGVDLCKDKYLLDLLKDLKSPGFNHYAIIGCKDDVLTKKNTYSFLESMCVHPILYDEDKPECLEMLLHKFLIDSNNIPPFPLGEIDYRYSYQDLVGREKQIEQLDAFLNKENKFLWTIIKGNRHTGRTKLVYDFSRMYASDWEWYILEPEEIDEFLSSQIKIQEARKKERKLLITFDNFHWYKGTLDKIFESKVSMNIYTVKVRFIFVLYDVKQSLLLQTLQNSVHDYLWFKIMESADSQLPISIEPLSVDEILQLCHGYIYYRSYQLGIEKKLCGIFDLIDEKLKAYILELDKKKEPEILALSQLKAVNLVKELNGSSYLKDSELAELVFQLSITIDKRPPNSTDFDYDKWYLDLREEQFQAYSTKEYFKNKEKDIAGEICDRFEDTEISRMLNQLNFMENLGNGKEDENNKWK